MTWNYRIVRYADGSGHGLHEVYYDDAGKPNGMTERAVGFHVGPDETIADLAEQVVKAIDEAYTKPVLDEPAEWAS